MTRLRLLTDVPGLGRAQQVVEPRTAEERKRLLDGGQAERVVDRENPDVEKAVRDGRSR